MTDLYQRSIEIILQYQSPNGAFIASPNFPTYHFCWFRDASFVAYSMNLAGQHESSRRFHDWAASQVNAREQLIHTSIQKVRAGATLLQSEFLHTRYKLDGQPDETGEWPNFQQDGFGTWLWALSEHCRLSSQELPPEWRKAADLVAQYLCELWTLPCYDCWEEFPDKVHPHTLAAIHAGLKAHTELSGIDHQTVLDAIKKQLLQNASETGHFVKFSGSPDVDASLLGLSVPYAVFAPDDPLMLSTISKIEQTILRDGGLHRYTADTYYGGGAWILLSAWLGWYYKQLAQHSPEMAESALKKAQELDSWIIQQAGQAEKDGWLPEQVPQQANNPAYFPEWIARWGQIADPLLWSHANYIIFHSDPVSIRRV